MPIEERQAEILLEPVYLTTEHWALDPDCHGRATEIEMLRRRDKITKLPKINLLAVLAADRTTARAGIAVSFAWRRHQR